MKKLLFSILIAILAIPAFAGTKLVTGSLADLKGAKSVPFIVKLALSLIFLIKQSGIMIGKKALSAISSKRSILVLENMVFV